MSSRRCHPPSRGLSPALSVILLVALTVTLVATLAVGFSTFTAPPTTPSTTFETDWTYDHNDHPQLHIIITGGDTIPTHQLILTNTDLTIPFSHDDRWSTDWPPTLSAGSSATTTHGPGLPNTEYTIVWQTDHTQVTLHTVDPR